MKKRVVTILIVVALLFSPLAVGAATSVEVQNKIKELLALVAKLQAQLDILLAEQAKTTNPNLVKGTAGVDVYKTERQISDIETYLNKVTKEFEDGDNIFSQSKLDSLVRGVDSVALFDESVQAFVGNQVTVSGKGLSGNVIIHFSDDYSLKNQKANSFGRVTFEMPNIPKGSYDLIISTSSGVSNAINLIVQ